jgi:hypothetical protein
MGNSEAFKAQSGRLYRSFHWRADVKRIGHRAVGLCQAVARYQRCIRRGRCISKLNLRRPFPINLATVISDSIDGPTARV